MSELKLCPFCGTLPQANTWIFRGISETRYFCPNPECPHSVRTVTLEEWQTRPIEDALTARIAELEAENTELKERIAMLDVTAVFKSLGEMEHIEKVANLKAELDRAAARIAELEAEIDQLTAHSDIERQDDKSPNDTQTQTIVYGKESEK